MILFIDFYFFLIAFGLHINISKRTDILLIWLSGHSVLLFTLHIFLSF